MSEAIVSNYPDADLVSDNIKDWVDIFGVEGTYEWEIPVSSVPGFLIDETSHDIGNWHDHPTEFSCTANFEYNGYIFWIARKYGEILWKMNLSTKAITWLWENMWESIFYQRDTIYKDWDYIYFNYTNNGSIPSDLYNYKYNYVTNIWYSTAVPGHHTTWTLLSWYTTIWWLKYTGIHIMTNGSWNTNPNRHNFWFKIYS